MINILVKVKYGSHLYGTNTESSDLDIKGIFIPKVQDILLQRIAPVISLSRRKPHGESNTKHDVDYELYSPEKYLTLLAKGQSVALEMLFAPDSAFLSPSHPSWNIIKSFAPKILTKQAASFVHYCKQQASKYCIKGERVASAKNVLEHFTELEFQYGPSAKLNIFEKTLEQLADNNQDIGIQKILLANGKKELCFDICGKKALFNSSIKSARIIAQNVVNQYGRRAREAEQNDGVDWKALMHAVRVAYQAIEFLKYHQITFPRPEAEHLLAIKQGNISFNDITDEIERLMEEVETAALNSTLPESYDQNIIDNFIKNLYLEQIFNEFNKNS